MASQISSADFLVMFKKLISSTDKSSLKGCADTNAGLDGIIQKLTDESVRADAIVSYLNNPIEEPLQCISRASGWVREYPFKDGSQIEKIANGSHIEGLSKTVLQAVNTTALKSKTQNTLQELSMAAARASSQDPAQITTLSKIEKKED